MAAFEVMHYWLIRLIVLVVAKTASTKSAVSAFDEVGAIGFDDQRGGGTCSEGGAWGI